MKQKYIVISLLALLILPVPVTMAYGSLAMGNCKELENCEEQKDRVGADDDEVSRDGPDEKEDANCWGKVTSDFTTTQDGDGGGGRSFGEHASNPTGDEDNDTPREGVGNQDEDHPSDHADTVGPRFGSDEECTED